MYSMLYDRVDRPVEAPHFTCRNQNGGYVWLNNELLHVS